MNPDYLVIYEDNDWQGMWPLNAVRPSCDLRVGALRLWEKQRHAFGPRGWAAISLDEAERDAITTAFATRNETESTTAHLPKEGTVLWWNGAAIPPARDLAELGRDTPGIRYQSADGKIVGFLTRVQSNSTDSMRELAASTGALPEGWQEESCDAVLLQSPWASLLHLESELVLDVTERLHVIAGPVSMTGVHVLGELLVTAEQCEIEPGAVIDTREGPVLLDHGVRVGAQTHLIGPAYIGPGTELLGGRIARVAMGPECRIGGEVDKAIFQGYTNKRHQGFLGHAIIGEWVNLGAMTTNSDLKNNYGKVHVWVQGELIDSNESKIGCFLGDHVKTGIGTLLTTGCVVGPGSNLFGGGMVAPRFLPGWSWWDGKSSVPHEWEKFTSTARIAMERRGVKLDQETEVALRQAFQTGPTCR